MSASVTQLKVGDEGFLVTSIIERCPKVMMLRELIQNALEAAERGRDGWSACRTLNLRDRRRKTSWRFGIAAPV